MEKFLNRELTEEELKEYNILNPKFGKEPMSDKELERFEKLMLLHHHRESEEVSKNYIIPYDYYKPISLICPTRHRCHGIYHFLNSAYRTAWRYDTFEIIFICDDDDKASPAWIDICKTKFPEMDISYYIRPRSDFLNRDYFNYGAERAKGKYFWDVGDDLEFILPEWDKSIFDCLDIFYKRRPFDEESPIKDDIVYINIKCDTPTLPSIKWSYSCFPIISRAAVEAVGFFLIPEIPSWCGDYTIAELYHNMNKVMDIPYQIFKHIGVETGAIIGDENTERLNQIMIKYRSQKIAEKWRKEKAPTLKVKIRQAMDKARENWEKK